MPEVGVAEIGKVEHGGRILLGACLDKSGDLIHYDSWHVQKGFYFG